MRRRKKTSQEEVKVKESQISEMRRKRRKAFKTRKSWTTDGYGSQSVHHPHPQNVKDLENRTETDTSKATLLYTEGLEKSNENGAESRCPLLNREQNNTTLYKESKWFLSGSEDRRGKKRDCPSLLRCHQQERFLTGVTFGDPEGSLSGKITLQNSPGSIENFKSTKGKIITEVKCGAFCLKVEIEKNSLRSTRANVTQRKKSCPKIHRRYPGQLIWRCPCSRCHHSRHQTLLMGHTRDRKRETASQSKVTVASNEDPSLTVSTVGKKITVMYVNKSQDLFIKIEHSKQRKKGIHKYDNCSSNVTTKGCAWAPSLSAHGLQSKGHTFQNGQDTDGSLTPPPPPPLPLSLPNKFAHYKKKNPSIFTESLDSESNKKELGMLFAVSDNDGVEGAIPQQKNDQSNECTSTKENMSRTETFPPHSASIVHGPLEIKGTNSFNELLENGGEMEEGRKSILINKENTISEPHVQHDSGGRMHVMDTTSSQTQGGKESNVRSLPSLRGQYGEAKAASFFRKSSTNSEHLEFSTRSDSVSSCFSIDDVKPSLSSSPTSPSPSDLTAYSWQHKESTDDSFFSNLCEEDRMDSEYPQAPLENNGHCMHQESADSMSGDLDPIKQSMSKLSLHIRCTPGTGNPNTDCTRLLSVCQEHVDFRKCRFNEETLENAQQAPAQELLKSRMMSSLLLASPLSSTTSKESVPSHNRSDGGILESTQRQPNVKQSNVTTPVSTQETRGASKNWRGSIMTALTKALEQNLIPQSGSKIRSTLCGSMKEKDLEGLPTLHGNSSILPLWDTEEPNVEDEYRGIFEVLSNSDYIKACFQEHFPPLTTEDSLSVSLLDSEVSNLEAFLKEILGKGEWEEMIPILKEDPVECQMGEFVELNSERGEKHKDQKTNMPSSAQKQRILKDWKLEMNKLIKLSSEFPSRDSRASNSSQEEAIDQWAKRRKQFKESKKCSSTGGSSFASNITEGSITSEDGYSVDLGTRNEIEEKGFYTENFHSASWVFRGDDENPENSPRCLSKKPQPVAVRERTVKISKGTGDYPWGFRIQFSKPILVTEVDTNSAAEEAGLLIGDIVLAVNGTDVTSVAHSEAVNLARKGPDVLTLVVGSDISRCPNTPWPTCRGYLHKRTHSGFLKGWRKRWFVLKHDGYLLYYKRKKDEGKHRPLDVMKLEGAEVGIDSSLGKPFVFKCVPQSGTRTFCLCATSNQEMKRWLEAMDKAAHPVCQNHVWTDVTRHNSGLPPLAIKSPECLGLLHQLERSRDVWAQYYCILKDGCLYLYASIRSTQALGGLYLQGYTVSEQVLSFKQAVIELSPPSEEFQTFYFCAENETENKRWITALKTSIQKWLPLHQAIEDFMNRPLEETKM
ncbi:uncharacterized protein PDZPH1P isoform X2 [Monodelphis domestica]|nr:uncharacterized protein PDZPH1P isoform X2 [Monodelphis domestica]